MESWPKCEYVTPDPVYGDSYGTCVGGRIRGVIPDELGCLGERDIGECPVCHGSGERELTVDEAAEYLRTEAIRRNLPKPRIIVPEFMGEPWMIIFYYQKGNRVGAHEKCVKGDGLEKALQESARAARAVYERGKE